jgi:hypothetical protein
VVALTGERHAPEPDPDTAVTAARIDLEQYVVRAGLAEADSLIVGSRPHRDVPGLFGFSVQSSPGVSIDELARAGLFPHLQISVTTLAMLRSAGFDLMFPTPGKGAYHATVRVRDPLRPDDAARLSGLFVRRRNPYPVSKKGYP